jgi:hypothetical protein
MSAVLLPFTILAVVGLFVFVAWLSHRQAKARAAAIAAAATRLGWMFHGDVKDHDFDDRHPQFECFRRGHSRFAHNRLSGRVHALDTELPAEAGDYHYRVTSGSGKNRNTRTYRFSYAMVALPFGARLPSLRVRSENFFDKLAGAIGFEDIDFESAEFSRRHHVSSSDRRFAHALIDPRMIEFLLDVHPPLFELGSGVLLVVSGEARRRWEPGEFEAALNWAGEFLARWPAHLASDLRAGR